ncbi:MAG: T9SS type A sorting domain-containing protein [Bacteroidetes bacterium]|nr:T9SS type A sorting domain-containing protein [Bacteroidota bacterium]
MVLTGSAQVVFSGYTDFYRLNDESCYYDAKHQFDFNILANNAVLLDSIEIETGGSGFTRLKDWDSFNLGAGVNQYTYSVVSDGNGCGNPNSGAVIVPFSFPNHHFANDKVWPASTGAYPTLTRFPEFEFDTSNICNFQYPLVINPRRNFHFNAFNQFDAGTGQHSSVKYPGSREPEHDSKVNDASAEVIMNKSKVGVYVYNCGLRDARWNANDQPNVLRFGFFTVNVVSYEVPYGYVNKVNNESILSDEFAYYTYTPDQDGSIQVSYHAESSDSVVFEIAAGKDYYRGVQLSDIRHVGTNYIMKIEYSERSRIVQEESSYLNVLVTSYLNSQPYYATYTVQFLRDTTSSIQPNESTTSTFDIFPNPASDRLTINWKRDESVGFSIRSVDGRLVTLGVLQTGINNVDLTNELSGVYLLELNDKNYRTVKKFILK